MSRLRVMRVISRMNVGGPAVQVSGLMRALPCNSFEQRLFTGYCEDDEEDYLETQASDIDAIRIRGLGRAPQPLDDARALAALEREIRRFRPHIIHTHTAKAGLLGRVAALWASAGSARIHTFHGHLLHGYFGPLTTRSVVTVERALARRSERLVAVGPRVRDELLQAGIGLPEQYIVIPPGIELPPLPLRSEAREALGLRKTGPTVAFLGRLAPIKRVDRFLEVAELVLQAVPDVQFVVAGGGQDKSLLASQVAARRLPVAVLGWRSDIEVVLAASDLILLTSDNEGAPVSLIQAAMAGVPAVATDVGSVSDVVDVGKTGWLTSTHPDALAAAVVGALQDPGELRRRGLRAQVRAKAEFGRDRLIADHARMYFQVARSRTG